MEYDNKSVFIIGGSFRKKGSTFLVQKRSWEMLRIFSDQFAQPVFGMVEASLDKTLSYPLPDSVKIVEIPSIEGLSKYWKCLFQKSDSDMVRKEIDRAKVVYLRLPAWECLPIFNYAVKKNKQIISSFHGDWVSTYSNLTGHISKKYLGKILAVYVEYVLNKIAKKSEILFCVGTSLFNIYGPMTKMSVNFANFLHSENDIALPHDACLKPPYKLLYVGSFEPRKGLAILIDAVRILKLKGIDIQLKLVGAGPEKQRLKKKISSFALESEVSFHPYVQHGKELMQIFRESDMFILPSISSEGMPKVLMEALTQATPVIATDVGSSKYILDHGRCGLIVPPGRADKLAEAVGKLISDNTFVEAIVGHGLKVARNSTKIKQEQIVLSAMKKVLPDVLAFSEYKKEINNRE